MRSSLHHKLLLIALKCPQHHQSIRPHLLPCSRQVIYFSERSTRKPWHPELTLITSQVGLTAAEVWDLKAKGALALVWAWVLDLARFSGHWLGWIRLRLRKLAASNLALCQFRWLLAFPLRHKLIRNHKKASPQFHSVYVPDIRLSNYSHHLMISWSYLGFVTYSHRKHFKPNLSKPHTML